MKYLFQTIIEDLLALMFADDVSCFSDTVIRLHRLIDLIEYFCKSVGIKLNLRKTKNVFFFEMVEL